MMNMKRILSMVTLIVTGLIFSVAAHAGQITLGAFGAGAVTQTYDDGLGLLFKNTTPLTIGADTYTTDNGTLRYSNSFGSLMGTTGGAIGTDTDLGFIDIVLGTSAFRAGLDFGTTANWHAVVEFFDAGNTRLGFNNVSSSARTHQFAGWEDTSLIFRIRITDLSPQNDRIIFVDNLITEVQAPIPEPTTIALLGIGLAGLAGAEVRRRRKKKAVDKS